jgi:hypothetical protein
MKSAVEMISCGMIKLQGFMKIDRGVQAILRFCFSNLECYNVNITDGMDL